MFSLRESRRWFLRAAGGLLAALSVEKRIRADTPIPTTVYVLDPNWGASDPACTGDCHACKACQKHAQNRRFATEQAAHEGRAHSGCKCLIRTITVTTEEYVTMFGVPGTPQHRTVHDYRTQTPNTLKWNYIPMARIGN